MRHTKKDVKSKRYKRKGRRTRRGGAGEEDAMALELVKLLNPAFDEAAATSAAGKLNALIKMIATPGTPETAAPVAVAP